MILNICNITRFVLIYRKIDRIVFYVSNSFMISLKYDLHVFFAYLLVFLSKFWEDSHCLTPPVAYKILFTLSYLNFI